jgi:cytochrome P450
MLRFSNEVVRRRSVMAGSMGHDILAAADAGELPRDECAKLMVDYLVPSLDTTISGIANALALFAMDPEQWKLLRTEPALLPNAINEVLRFESPLRAFTRKVARSSGIANTSLPAGARVLVLYASAWRSCLRRSGPGTP